LAIIKLNKTKFLPISKTIAIYRNFAKKKTLLGELFLKGTNWLNLCTSGQTSLSWKVLRVSSSEGARKQGTTGDVARSSWLIWMTKTTRKSDAVRGENQETQPKPDRSRPPEVKPNRDR